MVVVWVLINLSAHAAASVLQRREPRLDRGGLRLGERVVVEVQPFNAVSATIDSGSAVSWLSSRFSSSNPTSAPIDSGSAVSWLSSRFSFFNPTSAPIDSGSAVSLLR